ncbi:MAG: type II secretion system protein [Rhodocyclaceae bacterium]|nr:MAG: type II secretion system protein [Rhodocyclaceae bacterium]
MFIRRSAGLTLIELVVFIVIVSVALAGVLSVFTTVTRGSADPVRQKQAFAVAESMMEEVLNSNFSNPSGGYVPAGCPVLASCDRTKFDNVSDFNGYGSNPNGICTGATIGIRSIDSAANIVLPNYDLSVAVTTPGATFSGGTIAAGDAVTTANYRIVTVTVRDCKASSSYTLTGYKFNND